MNKKTSKHNTPHFFWEKKANKNRSRFNLLLLEHGEYLLEDLSAFYFPIPTNDLTTAFEVKDSLKIQGRLKLSTRSLIFEPGESRYPIIRFPYKSMQEEIEVFNLKELERRALSIDVSGFFTFIVQNCIEMKENNKIGPYKYIEHAAAGGHRSVIALVHADLAQFLTKVEQLRHIFTVSQKQGTGVGTQLLKPFIETAQLWTLQFDTSHLVNFHEKLLFERPVAAKKIKPLIVHPGSLMLTDSRVYFQPSQLNNIGDSVVHFEVRHIARVFRRRYLLQQTGLEFILTDNTSHLFVLDSESIRNITYNLLVNLRALSPQARGGGSGGELEDAASRQTCLEALCKRWQRRELSNFEYLMQLNSEADRSMNDITQYPVFPHVVADFASKKLDLEKPATFRDLSKPIGALNAERLAYFKQRMQSMPPADPALGIPPPFLYGTHYSTPGYVLHYLVRVAPEYMLCLQNGKFDAPDRMFHSIESSWQSCLNNPTDLKELIPEFFTGSGEFLVNFDDLDLGHLHTGERLSDVALPAWAESPRDFVRKSAKALECEYVSDHLHEWIDLIFGHKQKGAAAIEADNLYYYLTYEGAVDLDRVTDSRERDALVMQIQEFGQTPKQLFTRPHLCRNSRLPDMKQEREEAQQYEQQNTHAPAQAQATQSLSRPGSSRDHKETLINAGTAKINKEEHQQSAQPEVSVAVGAEKRLAEIMSSNDAALQQAMQQEQERRHSKASAEDDEDQDGVAIVHLDEAFRREVALELLGKPGSAAASDETASLPSLVVMSPSEPPFAPSSTEGRHSRNHSSNSRGTQSATTSPSHPATSKHFNAAAGKEKETRPAETLLSTVLNWTFGTPSAAQRQSTARTQKANELRPDSPATIRQQPTSSSAPAPAGSAAASTTETAASVVSGRSGFHRGNPRKIVMQGSEAYYWHSKEVTGVCALLYQDSSLLGGRAAVGGGTGITEVVHALVASVSRDANLKVSQVEQVVSGEFVREQNRRSLQVTVAQTNVSLRRTNSVSTSSLSAVCLLADKNHALFSSWDNNIYGYSISHARTLGKTYAHDDAVTGLSMDGRFVLSGSLDASVKLWELCSPSRPGEADSLLAAAPVAEFRDLDSAVHAVALSETARFAAAGTEDGALAVWDLQKKTLKFVHLASPARKPINCLQWLTRENSAFVAPAVGFAEEKLLCGTEDGQLLCLDRGGRVFASTTLASGALRTEKTGEAKVSVRCLQCDGGLIYGGCSDGSIRCWTVQAGSLSELYRHSRAHSGAISSISMAIAENVWRKPQTERDEREIAVATKSRTVSSNQYTALGFTAMLVTAGEDCAVKIWRIHCSGDY